MLTTVFLIICGKEIFENLEKKNSLSMEFFYQNNIWKACFEVTKIFGQAYKSSRTKCLMKISDIKLFKK